MKFGFSKRGNRARRRSDRPSASASSFLRSRRLRLEPLEERALLAVDAFSQFDINRDGAVTPLDALMIVNELNTNGSHIVGGAPGSRLPSILGGTRTASLTAGNSGATMDVNSDNFITPLDALLVINRLNDQAQEVARIRLQVTDTGGNPISQIQQGQNFLLRAFVQDLRAVPSDQAGVFAAFTDVTWSSSLASVNGLLSFGSDYPNGRTGNISVPGLLDEVGAFDGTTPLGPSERLLFSVPMQATGSGGTINFIPDPADQLPTHDILLFGESAGTPSSSVSYVGASLAIVALPMLSIDDVQTTEGNSGTKTLQFTVSLTAASVDTITVAYATAPNTAAAGSDYVSDNNTLTFLPGQTSKTVTITINGDATNEADETFFVNLTAPTKATIAKAQGIGTILNDDPQPVLAITGVSAPEGNGGGTTNFQFNVALSAASGQTVTVQYQTVAGSASAGSDYQTASGTLTFLPGETTKTIDVAVVADNLNETNESFQVNLSGPQNAVFGVSSAAGNIQNDDPLPTISIGDASLTEPGVGTAAMTFTVTLSAASGQTVTAAYQTAPGTATADEDYQSTSGTVTFNPGETSKTITVLISADSKAEADETVLVNLSAPTNATIADAQGVGTIADLVLNKQVRIRLEATDMLGNPVSVVTGGETFLIRAFVKDVTASPNGVFAGYVDITFDPALIAVIGPIEYSDDYPNVRSGNTSTPGLIDEAGATGGTDFLGASERLLFSVKVQGIGGGTATFGAEPADVTPLHDVLAYGSNDPVPPAAVLYLGIGPIEITPPRVLSVSSPTIVEGNAGTKDLVFTVSLDAAVGKEVTVDYATVAGTAAAGQDYQTTSGKLTFAAGETSMTVVVPIVGDTTNEANEQFRLQLSNAVNAVIPFGQGFGTATIQNDDPLPTLTVQNASAIEGISQAVFTFNLSAASGQVVSVNYGTTPQSATGGGVDYQNASGTVTFQPGETTKTVTVNVVNDDAVEGEETFLLALSAPSNVTLAGASATGTINDIPRSSLAGYIYGDADNDGVKDAGEFAFVGIRVRLQGTNMLGQSVDLETTTASDGSYRFANLIKGNYVVTEVQPEILLDGIDTVGSLGGDGSVNDQFTVALDIGVDGVNYNFGERGLKPGALSIDDFYASSLNGRRD